MCVAPSCDGLPPGGFGPCAVTVGAWSVCRRAIPAAALARPEPAYADTGRAGSKSRLVRLGLEAGGQELHDGVRVPTLDAAQGQEQVGRRMRVCQGCEDWRSGDREVGGQREGDWWLGDRRKVERRQGWW